jgi:hypothetical protein
LRFLRRLAVLSHFPTFALFSLPSAEPTHSM